MGANNSNWDKVLPPLRYLSLLIDIFNDLQSGVIAYALKGYYV